MLSAVETSRGSVAGVWHYLALAEQKLNKRKNSAAGKKKEFVSTRFLGYARNDRGENVALGMTG